MQPPLILVAFALVLQLCFCTAHAETLRVANVETARTRFALFFAAKRRALLQSMLDEAGSGDTVAVDVLTNAEVTSPKVLFDANIRHAIVNEGFNDSIPALAPNISFSYPFAIPASLSSLPNVEEVLVPIENMGVEAGLLAGLATVTNIVTMWYSAFYSPEIITGVLAGVRHVCPLCTVHAYATCSVLTACSGEEDLTTTTHPNSDVVITSSLLTSELPTSVFERNKNSSTTTLRSVIAIGNTLDDLSNAVSASSDFLGCVSVLQTSSMAGVASALLGNFVGGSRRLLYHWTTSFKRNSTDVLAKRALTAAVANEFLLQRILFNAGVSAPTYDAISDAALSAEDIGGLPFVPVGYAVFGVDPVAQRTTVTQGVLEYLLPPLGEGQAAYCVFKDRLIMVSADLTTLTIYSVTLGKIASVRIDVGDQVYADAAAVPALAPYFNASRRLEYATVALRQGMRCSHIQDELILTGGTYVEGDSAAVATDVLRLFPVCVAPVSTECDYFLIENITASTHDAASLQRPSDADGTPAAHVSGGADFGTAFALASTPSGASPLAFVLPDYSRRATVQQNEVDDALDTTASSSVSILNMTGPQRYATVALLTLQPPSGVASSTFAPTGAQWVEAIPALLALDARRNVIVRVRGDVFNRSQFSASGTTAAWEDATTALPADATPTCFFYNHAVGRIVVFAQRRIEGSIPATTAPVVYHYSTHLQVWVLQSTLIPMPGADPSLRCVPLLAVGGGSALLTPQTTYNVNNLVLVWYPAEVPLACTLAEGEGLSPSLQACQDCSVLGLDATPDGFCTAKGRSEAKDLLPPWAIALVVVCVVGIAAAIAVAVRGYLADRVALQGRNLENAPPSGTVAVLFLTLADADVMWTGGANDMHAILDHLHRAVSQSAGANRCYLQSFRGDQAVVVSAAAVDVLCVAVEVSLTMSRLEDNPVRLACGLHVAELVRSSDYGVGVRKNPAAPSPDAATPRRYFYSGHGLYVCKKSALASKHGALMATDAFLDDVNDTMIKHLGLVRGNTLSLQLDNAMFAARELVLSAVMDVFQATSAFDDARERRTRILKQKREHTAGGSKRKAAAYPPQQQGGIDAGGHAIAHPLLARLPRVGSGCYATPSTTAGAPSDALGSHHHDTGGDISGPASPFNPPGSPVVQSSQHTHDVGTTHRGDGGVALAATKQRTPRLSLAEEAPTTSGVTTTATTGGVSSNVFACASHPFQMSMGINFNTSMSMSCEQDDVLIGLAVMVLRTLLSNLAQTPQGCEALECIATRLYIPLRTPSQRTAGGGKLPTTIPPSMLRALAQRVLTMCPRIPDVVAQHRGAVGGGGGTMGNFFLEGNASGSGGAPALRSALRTPPLHQSQHRRVTATSVALQTPPKQDIDAAPDAMEFSIRSIHNTSSTSIQEQQPTAVTLEPFPGQASDAHPPACSTESPPPPPPTATASAQRPEDNNDGCVPVVSQAPNDGVGDDWAEGPVTTTGVRLPPCVCDVPPSSNDTASIRGQNSDETTAPPPVSPWRRHSVPVSDATADAADRSFGTLTYRSSSRSPHHTSNFQGHPTAADAFSEPDELIVQRGVRGSEHPLSLGPND